MNSRKNKDLEIGERSETHNIEVLNKYFNLKLEKLDKFNKFDFEDKNLNTIIELKTRLCSSGWYKDTMIPYHKIEYLNKLIEERPEIRGIFAFCFLDGLYYIDYDPELFKTFRKAEGGRYDRGYKETNIYLYIPTDKLIKIKEIDPILKKILK